MSPTERRRKWIYTVRAAKEISNPRLQFFFEGQENNTSIAKPLAMHCHCICHLRLCKTWLTNRRMPIKSMQLRRDEYFTNSDATSIRAGSSWHCLAVWATCICSDLLCITVPPCITVSRVSVWWYVCPLGGGAVACVYVWLSASVSTLAIFLVFSGQRKECLKHSRKLSSLTRSKSSSLACPEWNFLYLNTRLKVNWRNLRA